LRPQSDYSDADADVPPWIQDGGYLKRAERLKDPSIRRRVEQEMVSTHTDWDNLYAAAEPDKILLVGFCNTEIGSSTRAKPLPTSPLCAIRARPTLQWTSSLPMAAGSRLERLDYAS
jgi:N-acyl-D-amino-acid deacylase